MPARSQSQRNYLNWRFGHDWVKRHHFDNKGKLPDKVEKEIPDKYHYRRAENSKVMCGTCAWYENGVCTMFDDTPVGRGMVCDAWDNVKKDLPHPHGEHHPQYWAKVPGGLPDEMEGLNELRGALEPAFMNKGDVKAAGIAVRAADTGRVLMIQRANAAGDPAAGCWEFPGGILLNGEHPYTGAKREWQEEMGVRLPSGAHVGEWRSGVYHGFIHEVPKEGKVRINQPPEGRRVMNPDDPDKDNVEVAAWFHPEQLKRMSSLRDELRVSRPWNRVQKAEGAVYLVSHAKTRFNKPGHPHDKVQSWMRIGLDATGRAQSRALGKWFASRGVTKFFCSDLPRAKQTADIIGRVADIPVDADKKYRPWNMGDFAGHSSADVVPKLKQFMHKKPDEPVGGGESYNSFKNRFIPAFEQLMKMAEKGDTVGLVAHSRNVELVQGWLEGKGYRSKIDTAAIDKDDVDPATIFEIKKGRSGKWQMRQLDDEGVSKDGVPGSVGDLPSTSTENEHRQAMPASETLNALPAANWSGPTIQQVHVPRPLKNISILYMNKQYGLEVKKAEQHKQIIYGVVLEPNVLDSQDDFMIPDQVERAAHTYLKRVSRGQASVSKLQHRAQGFFKQKPSVVPVESFIAPCDFSYDGKETVRKGTWVMALHIEDDGVWRDVMDGKYTGLSIGGSGIRQEFPPSRYMSDTPAQWGP